jgi:hypothetical protein
VENKYLQQLSWIRDQVTVGIEDESVLRIKRTPKTPFVYLNRREGIVIFAGVATPEDDTGFYRPIVDFIRSQPWDASKIAVFFRVEYVNTSSSKCLLDLLKTLNQLFLSGKSMNILWFQEADDPDDYLDGEDWLWVVKTPFDIIELHSDEIEELDSLISQL